MAKLKTPTSDLTGWLQKAAENEQVVSVLQIDLDGFDAVNREGGREVGDRVIEAAWATVSRAAKTDGWRCERIGGDEFAVVAPIALEPAFLRADTLRRELDEAMAAELPKGLRCTASIGVANLPRDAKTPDELMRKADLALYSAKEQGGDAVGLTPGEEMVLRSSYYTVAQLARLRSLAERLKKKEAVLLREALDDLLRKYDRS